MLCFFQCLSRNKKKSVDCVVCLSRHGDIFVRVQAATAAHSISK